MGTYYEGGAVIAHKARLLIACGGRGGREHPPLTHIQSNACRFLFLLFSYLRFAEAASFDKKELCRSDTDTDQTQINSVVSQDDFSIPDIRGIVVRKLEEIEAAEGPEDVKEATRTLVRPSI